MIKTNKKSIFIFGCQRSGTTLLKRLLHNPPHTFAYNEKSVLSEQDPQNLRLNPLPRVIEQIEERNERFIVIKPLVNSQEAERILNAIEWAKGIWMYRHYLEVSQSFINQWGKDSGYKNLSKLDPDKMNSKSWQCQNLPEATLRFYRENRWRVSSEIDACCLFWAMRNHLLFCTTTTSNG